MPGAGGGEAAGGQSAVRAAGMEVSVWRLKSATVNKDILVQAVKKVNILPHDLIIYFRFQLFAIRNVEMGENAEKMVGADVRKDSLDRDVKWKKSPSVVKNILNGKEEKEGIKIDIG